MQAIPFTLIDWAAWAPGLESREDWHRWAIGEQTIATDDSVPRLAFIKPMLRRRFSRLTKMALQAAFQCLEQSESGQHELRTVFCSRHGEIHRTKGLLDDLVRQEPLSPMGFSLSVHNTASGLYSIASGNKSPSSAIAAGVDTFEMALVDAIGYLQREPEKRVLLVLADEPLPAFYQAYDTELAKPHAVALLLASALDVPANVALSAEPMPGSKTAPNEPHGLQFLHWLLNDRQNHQVAGERLQWTWEKLAAELPE